MPPYDPAEAELFSALEYVYYMLERYDENIPEEWQPLIIQTEWQAW